MAFCSVALLLCNLDVSFHLFLNLCLSEAPRVTYFASLPRVLFSLQTRCILCRLSGTCPQRALVFRVLDCVCSDVISGKAPVQVHLGAPAGRINGLAVTDGGTGAVVQDGDANRMFKYDDQTSRDCKLRQTFDL